MGKKRAFSVGLGLAISFGVSTLTGLAHAKAQLNSPTPRVANDSITTTCDGSGAGTPQSFVEGATALTVKVSDGVNDMSVGCFQVVIFNGTTQVGSIFQATDDQAAVAARTVDVANVTIPTGCRGGNTCTVHMRQLVNAAAGCPTAPAALGTGATATFYSCGDFRVRQPQPPPDASTPVDAAVPPPQGDSSTPPPSPTNDSGFTPIPVPEGDGGVVRVSGLNPDDATSEGCAIANVGAQSTVWGATGVGAMAVAGLVLGLRRRRR